MLHLPQPDPRKRPARGADAARIVWPGGWKRPGLYIFQPPERLRHHLERRQHKCAFRSWSRPLHSGKQDADATDHQPG
ncbi:UNVERIFIED_CONTAM: hypothetical protein GTU68_055181 [Idotea baltica]|nr:hypothetical protein [Idotea baltica]